MKECCDNREKDSLIITGKLQGKKKKEYKGDSEERNIYKLGKSPEKKQTNKQI